MAARVCFSKPIISRPSACSFAHRSTISSWAASLAYYMELFGSEAGLVLSTAAHGLFNLPADSVPHAVLAPPVVAFLQAAFLLLGGGAATALTWKLGTEVAPARAVSQAGGIAAAGLVLWHLIVRTDFLQG